MTLQSPNIRTSNVPRSDRLRWFLKLINGVDESVYAGMTNTIKQHIGTPQNTTDWSDQPTWIPQILSGKERELAQYLYNESDGILHLRYLGRIERIINAHELTATDPSGHMLVTEAGQSFADNPLGEVEQRIDYLEGSLHLLQIIAESGPGKRADFMDDFINVLEKYSNYRSSSVFNYCWYHRIRNFQARGFVDSSGFIYEITEAGLSYLEATSSWLTEAGSVTVTQEQTDILRLIKQQKDDVREQIRTTLLAMNPFTFEHLVKDLLVAIGYEDAEVTTQSGDGGVDVIANIEVGISSVREVVQVKRYKSNVQRKVLDELRGSLHRFDATRGTIITTGGFASGAVNAAFERGAAPITLINGDRLIDLLIEHEIGVRKRTLQLIEFEPADFSDNRLLN